MNSNTSPARETRGRKPNPPGTVSVNLNSKPAVELALQHLDCDSKRELVLRNTSLKTRESPNGIRPGMKVRFSITQVELEARYPDHSLGEEYVAGVVSYPFESDSGKYQVRVSNAAGLRCGIVATEDLETV